MKTNKLFALIAVAALALASCKKEDPTPVFEPSLKVDKTEKIAAPAEGTTATVKVTANISWTATASQDWVSVAPASKSITDKKSVATDLTVTVSANAATEARNATVTLKAEGCDDIVLNIEQTAGKEPEPEPVFEALDDEGNPITAPFEVGSAGEEISIYLNSNLSWTAVSSDESWLNVDPASYTAESKEVIPTSVTITAATNTSEERSATVTFKAEGQADIVITVNQEAATTFTIDVSNVTYNGATVDVTPSKDNIYYYFDCQDKAYTPENDEDLFNDDMDYYYRKYGQSYAQYGFDSYEELYFTGIASQGADDLDLTGYLDPETTYVVYAYEVLPGFKLGSVVARYEFTTPEAPAPDPSYSNLLGTWNITGMKYSNGWKNYSTTWTLSENIVNESYILSFAADSGLDEDEFFKANFDGVNKVISIPTLMNNRTMYNYNVTTPEGKITAYLGLAFVDGNSGDAVENATFAWNETYTELTPGVNPYIYWGAWINAASGEDTGYIHSSIGQIAILGITKAASEVKACSVAPKKDRKNLNLKKSNQVMNASKLR